MRTLPVLALVLGLSAPAFAKEKGSPQDETAMNDKVKSFTNAWNKHDPSAMAENWASDGTLINPFGREAKGREEVQKLFQDEHSMAMKKSTMSPTPLEVHWVKPDVALADSTFMITGMTDPNGKILPTMKSHVSMLMVKTDNGWSIADARAFNFMPEAKKPSMGRKTK